MPAIIRWVFNRQGGMEVKQDRNKAGLTSKLGQKEMRNKR